jgi:phosphate:Na+ symporter
MDEFDGADSAYLNAQYTSFRKRLVSLYHSLGHIADMSSTDDQYIGLRTAYRQVEEADNRFIKGTMRAVAEKHIMEMDISTLLLVNRLFTQACRMQIFGLKDLFLGQEQIQRLDRDIDSMHTTQYKNNGASSA